MGIQAIPLNHYLNEVPEKTAASLQRKATALNILEKISWVAFIAIMGTILTVAYSGTVLTGSMPLLLVGMALVSPLLGFGASQLNMWSSSFAKRAEIERGVAAELNQIAHWGTPEIEQFLRDHGVARNRIPLEALQQKNPTEPLKALLPLIARFRLFHKLEVRLEEESRNELNPQIEQDIQQSEARRGRPTEEARKRTIRLVGRQIAWAKHEHYAIPRGFDAAVMLQIIQNPTINLTVSEVGEFRSKTFEERQFDLKYAPRNDDYFAFHPDLRRPSLTLTQIERDMSPRAIRALLFPREVLA